MSLYKQWTDMVVEYVKVKGEAAFWKEYSDVETKIYKDLLANHKEVKKATIADLAKEYGTTEEFVMGFVDGINDSLKTPYDLEKVESNMLDAKADYLFNLPQWDAIFSGEKRREIQFRYRDSKTVRNEEVKVGRNEPCPCGSGKKYKKCCGK